MDELLWQPSEAVIAGFEALAPVGQAKPWGSFVEFVKRPANGSR